MKNERYFAIDELKPYYAYEIDARNAPIGIWSAKKRCFIICRFKVGPNPYLHVERHYDYCHDELQLLGTAKPIRLIAQLPKCLRELLISTYDEFDQRNVEINCKTSKALLLYLESLESKMNEEQGTNTLEERRESAMSFLKHLQGTR
ncbi:hypothetical protein [Glaciecola sp. KUL10]|uniref:hypothetical protein n=1 Tax=Glaciecola sp. (strain KUL10) TaxID=2161813 RepID=UPI000D78B638|nr:hypothetical protein [Glaciecola sp. KUL10]GBL04791.1 hypothetical protein KUL10_21050 [Glaciecola sp. KUL10]